MKYYVIVNSWFGNDEGINVLGVYTKKEVAKKKLKEFAEREKKLIEEDEKEVEISLCGNSYQLESLDDFDYQTFEIFEVENEE